LSTAEDEPAATAAAASFSDEMIYWNLFIEERSELILEFET
jgi:hypothetical protein